MPNDIFYGSEAIARIGVMADQNSDPETWYFLEYKTITMTPDKGKTPRPLVGRALQNKLDPQKPRDGFFSLKGEIVIDADSRGLPRLLRAAFGAPSTTGPAAGIYTHAFASGGVNEVYFALQIQMGAKVRVYRGLTGTALSFSGKGDQANNYDISISVQGLTRDTIDDWLGDDPAAIFAPAPAQRLIMKVGGTAASNILDASLNYTRKVSEGNYLSQTIATSELRPDAENEHTGQCTVRAVGQAFDDLENADTPNDIVLQFTGLPAGHDIQIEHPLAILDAAPDKVDGPGLIERAWSWKAFQDASHAALLITVKNDNASYA